MMYSWLKVFLNFNWWWSISNQNSFLNCQRVWISFRMAKENADKVKFKFHHKCHDKFATLLGKLNILIGRSRRKRKTEEKNIHINIEFPDHWEWQECFVCLVYLFLILFPSVCYTYILYAFILSYMTIKIIVIMIIINNLSF